MSFVINRGGQRIWSGEKRAELETLWPKHTSAEIARRLGTSRDSVTKQAHRLGLPAKVPPIHTAAATEGARRARERRPQHEVGVHAKRAAPVSQFFVPLRVTPARCCQWPLTSQRPWRFCEAPLAKGSYCAEHAEQAFAKPGGWVP
jgi:hypothetical protein